MNKQLVKEWEVKKTLSVLSVIIGGLAYLYMIISMICGDGEGVSFTTFALWAALAWISAFTMLKQGASPGIPAIYGVGSTSTAIVLILKGRIHWTGMDSFIAFLVLLCIIFWMIKGARWALILSVLAAVIAGIPFIIMTWKAPLVSPIIPSSGFLLANFLSFVSAKAWTLEDRLYSGVNVIVTALLVIPWILA